jgi:hypothetical protein
MDKKEVPNDPRTGRIQLAQGLDPPTGGGRGTSCDPEMAGEQGAQAQAFPARIERQTGAGVYIWPSVEAAQRAHDEAWRQSVIKRTGGAPTIRYFDLFLLIDNEAGTVTEFPTAAEIKSAAA